MSRKVDIHSHIFNLHFLPVAGAIRGISKNYPISPNGLPVFLCRLIAKYYLKRMERNEVEHTKSMVHFQEMNQNFDDLVDILLIKDPTVDDVELKEFIVQHIGNYTLSEIGVSNKELESLKFDKSLTVEKFLINAENSQSIESLSSSKIVWMIIRFIAKWVYERYLKSYLDWFNFMTKDYEAVTAELFAEYPEIDVFIHHDMDMDDWYELEPPKYAYDEQVRLVQRLAENCRGKLIPFFAYNPKKSLDLLKQTLNYSGGNQTSYYKGVKFYPPSGYQPWYEDQSNDYQVRNLELFTFCVEHDIPVFTHCNYGGMEAGKDYWRNNDVKYWAKVLEKFSSLRLCFGHSGGDAGWLGEFDNKKLKKLGHDTFEKSFPGQIYHLCIKYKHVYCEFGYLPDVMNVKKRNIFRKRLVSCIEDSKGKTYQFENKIMYGTDWHMIMQEHGFNDYYQSFEKLFDHESLKEYNERFFGSNALVYLKLN